MSQNVVHRVRSPLNFFKDNFGSFTRGERPPVSGGVGDREGIGVFVCDPGSDGVELQVDVCSPGGLECGSVVRSCPFVGLGDLCVRKLTSFRALSRLMIQGVVTAMCPVLPPATAIKVKSRDQAHRRATIKGSRWRSGRKYDQNQNKNTRRYNITSDTLKCRSFLAQLGARMRNLRPCDNGKFPFSSLCEDSQYARVQCLRM